MVNAFRIWIATSKIRKHGERKGREAGGFVKHAVLGVHHALIYTFSADQIRGHG